MHKSPKPKMSLTLYLILATISHQETMHHGIMTLSQGSEDPVFPALFHRNPSFLYSSEVTAELILAEADASRLESSEPTRPHTLQRTGWWLSSPHLFPNSKSTNLDGNLYTTPLSACGRWEGKSGMKLAGNPMNNEAESHKYITRLWTSVLRLVSHPHNSWDLHAASTARMGRKPAPQPRKKHHTPWVSGHEHNLGCCLFYFLGGEQTDSLHGLC